MLKPKGELRKCAYWYYLILDKIHEFMTFSIYFRYIILIYQYLVLTSLATIYNFIDSQDVHMTHLLIAIFVLVFCLGFAFYSYYIYFIASCFYKMEMFQHTGEIFRGVRDKNLARFYTPLLLTRRLALVIWVVFTTPLPSVVTVIGMVTMQALGLLTVIMMFPFETILYNTIEIMNEVFLVFFFSWLLYYDRQSRWTTKATYTYIFVIMANIILILALSIIAFVHLAITKMKKKPEEPTTFSNISVNSPAVRKLQADPEIRNVGGETFETNACVTPRRRIVKKLDRPMKSFTPRSART